MDFVSVKNDTDKVELGMMSIVRSHRQRPYWYMLNHIQKVKTGETAVDVCLCCVTCVCVFLRRLVNLPAESYKQPCNLAAAEAVHYRV
jgi:hypothetical protein